jgi:hypothetical protein
MLSLDTTLAISTCTMFKHILHYLVAMHVPLHLLYIYYINHIASKCSTQFPCQVSQSSIYIEASSLLSDKNNRKPQKMEKQTCNIPDLSNYVVLNHV